MRTISAYNPNILFSYMRTSKTLNINLSEYKSIKDGGYKKLISKYYDLYGSDGLIHENNTGLFFDQKV